MTSPFLARATRKGAIVRVFCLPYAGAGASRYFHWAHYFPGQVEVCPILLPGREGRLLDEPFTDLQALVREVANALLPECDRPFSLFGHSMGALICFELSRHLRQSFDLVPLRLFVSGHRAPHLPDPEPHIHALSDRDLFKRARQMEGSSGEVFDHQEYMGLMLPTLRADLKLCETYRYLDEAPLRCPISVFGGLQDSTITEGDLVAWREHTSESCLVRFFAGGHLFLNDCGAIVAESIVADLDSSLVQYR